MNWHRFPLLRILTAYTVGILAALFFPKIPAPAYWVIFIFFILSFSYLLFRNVVFRFRFDWFFGLFISLLFLAFGWQRSYYRSHFIDTNHFSNLQDAIAYLGYIEEEPIEKARSWKSTVCIQYVRNETRWQSANGKMLCYFSKENYGELPKSGECILFFSKPEEIPPSLNPYAFNYRRYMAKQSITHRVYLSSGKWDKSEGKAPFSLSREALKLRSKLLDILENSQLTDSEFGVASAILLGYDDRLDPELRSVYSTVGASHILCVSGMHVGVVFMIFNVLLSFLGRKRHGKMIKALLLLLLIWIYAFITGLAPAVSRASVMISFMVVAQATGRKNNTWNAIIASALFLLIANPLLISDVGFQLSYAAVISIVALQKPLSSLVAVPTKAGEYIWGLITVSIAAQLGTAPLAMYYFHQFPNWFLLTNIAIIPLSAIIIYTGVAMLAFSFIPLLKTGIGWLLFWEIRITNYLMEWISRLPHAATTGINITPPELFLMLLIVIFLSLFFLKKDIRTGIVSLSCILLLAVSISLERLQHSRQSEFVIFEAGKSPVLGFIQGRYMDIFTDSVFFQNKNLHSFVISDYIIRKGIKQVSFLTESQTVYHETTGLYSCKNSFLFNGKRIFIMDKMPQKNEFFLPCDYLIIRNGYYGEPVDFLMSFKSRNIVVDASNSRAMQKKWSEINDSVSGKIHLLYRQGALVKNFYDKED